LSTVELPGSDTRPRQRYEFMLATISGWDDTICRRSTAQGWNEHGGVYTGIGITWKAF
jgi:hypothetical protein